MALLFCGPSSLFYQQYVIIGGTLGYVYVIIVNVCMHVVIGMTMMYVV